VTRPKAGNSWLVKDAAQRAGIDKNVAPHRLRANVAIILPELRNKPSTAASKTLVFCGVCRFL